MWFEGAYEYTFDDVLLKPQKSIVKSRSEVDLTCHLTRFHTLGIPIISAPMSSVTEWKMAVKLGELGGLGFIHRFMDIDANVGQYSKAINYLKPEKNGPNIPEVGCTIGVNEDYERFERLYDAGCRIFCVDVAHAHSINVETFMSGLDPYRREEIQLIAGNVATIEGAMFLEDLGVDAIKVGIGPGSHCRTREVTGFGVPQLAAIHEISHAVTVPVIADGGIKNSGDIVKALAAGAATVMLGRLLAGADEAPLPGKYFGMASERVNGHHAPEGVESTVRAAGGLAEIIKELTWGIRSGISYGGGSNIPELQQNAKWIKISHGTQIESAVRT